MKRSLLLAAFMASFLAQAQEKPYNQWSLDFGVGINKIQRDFAPGYHMPTADFPQASLGVRYMFNSRFGTRIDFGYQNISAEEESSIDFETQYYRASLEGVINLGNVLKFSNWTRSFNLLAHGGGGYSTMSFDAVGATDERDQMFNWIVGITPQLKLSNRISLNADFSMVGNLMQNSTYDGTVSSPHVNGQYDASMFKASLGFSISLGSKEHSADFYPEDENFRTALDSLQARVALLEENLQDTDEDGVANHLDREPNTLSGMSVNTKGVAVDKDKNGIPDDLEAVLDERYASKDLGRTKKVIAELLQEGYVNVYFGFNSDEPTDYSLGSINSLVIFFKSNTESRAELIGSADVIGDSEYNKELSTRRAESVYDILVAAGVSADRLSFTGAGEDDSVDPESRKARQLVRRVTIKLIP